MYVWMCVCVCIYLKILFLKLWNEANLVWFLQGHNCPVFTVLLFSGSAEGGREPFIKNGASRSTERTRCAGVPHQPEGPLSCCQEGHIQSCWRRRARETQWVSRALHMTDGPPKVQGLLPRTIAATDIISQTLSPYFCSKLLFCAFCPLEKYKYHNFIQNKCEMWLIYNLCQILRASLIS